MLPQYAVSLDRVARVPQHVQAADATDADSLTLLYRRHGRLLQVLAYRITSDTQDAEEVVQDVFAQAWCEACRYSGSHGAGARVAPRHGAQPGNRSATGAEPDVGARTRGSQVDGGSRA
jgi:hypothetical protein